MLVKACKGGNNNYQNPSGYGLKVKPVDRNKYFKREWGDVFLELPGTDELVKCNIDKDSFWNSTCCELISIGIGKWLINNGYAPWKKGHPPKLSLEPISVGRFVVRSL